MCASREFFGKTDGPHYNASIARFMFSNQRRHFLFTTLAFFAVGGVILGGVFYVNAKNGNDAAKNALDARIEKCAEKHTAADEPGSGIDKAINCWYSMLNERMASEGVAAAFEMFKRIYETQPLFVERGCHTHAHRMGDFAYFHTYLSITQDLSEIEFPRSTTVCGFGFYHGFIEHLIEDNPTVAFAQEKCDYFTRRLGDKYPDMKMTCFHAAGHGFMLDPKDRALWGNAAEMVKKPLAQCKEITDDAFLQHECRKGVFNVIVEWKFNEEYGLSYNEKDPFTICRRQPETYKEDCYYEMAMNLAHVVDFDVGNVFDMARSPIVESGYEALVARIPIAVMMQRALSNNTQKQYLEDCADLGAPDDAVCTQAVAGGIIEHGTPGEEATLGINSCKNAKIPSELAYQCYNNVFEHLSRTRTPEMINTICKKVPSPHRSSCPEFL